MPNHYDYISVDFQGHQSWEEDHSEEDISYKISECISDKIESLNRLLKYYNLFQKCLEEYTQFEITNARLLDENICRVESDIDYGERHLKGENTGTHGKECSTKIDAFEKQLDRLLNLWKDIPFDLKQLVKFDALDL